MVSKTLNGILTAEKKAEEKIQAAYKESDAILENANQKAAEIINAAKIDAQSQVVLMDQKNQSDITRMVEQNNAKIQADVACIRSEAEKSRDKAIDLAIQGILS